MRAFVAVAALLATTATAVAEPVKFPLANATVTTVRDTGTALSLSVAPEAASDFHAFTLANVGATVEFRIEGTTLLKAVILEPITNGRLRVGGGDFTLAELKALANRVPDGGLVMEAEVVAP